MVPIRILDQETRYQILKQIGQGGMGYVYEAIDTSVGKRRVAIKTLRDRPTEESLAMFEREIETLARLGDDDNIVSIINIGECEQDRIRKPYLVMPFLEGQTLDEVIRKGDRLSVERCLRIVRQVCQGLQAAHDKGIIHRDIKPSNIFLRLNDKVKIIDFGLARMVDARTSMGRKGTLRYMSPEQIAGDEIDRRSDLFSLGVVLYELLTRTHPFGLNPQVEADPSGIKAAIERKKPTLLKLLNPDVNDSLCCLGHKALQKDPRFRFQSAADMADDLEKVLKNEPLPYCNLDKIGPFLQEAKGALDLGKLDEASDILDDLEGRGYWHSRIEEVREQVQQAKTTGQVEKLLQQATEYIASDKPKLALNSLRRVLAIEPEQKEAKRLVTEVERLLEDRDLASLLESAQSALDNDDFDVAEQLIKNVISSRPNHPVALTLLKQIAQRRGLFQDRKHQEEAVFEKAVKALQSGDISTAFRNAEELVRLANFDKHPDPRYAEIYTKVRSTHDFLLRKYDEAEKLMEERKLHDAKKVCEEVLGKHPNDIGFRALLNRINHREIEVRSAEIATILAIVNNEPNLDRKLEILEQGLQDHQKEPRLLDAIRSAKELGEVVKSIVDAARELEYQQDFEGAEAQFETLRRIYPLYPGLDFQLARLRQSRHDHLKEKARTGIIDEIRRCLAEGLFDQAIDLANSSEEFRDDPSLEQLKKDAVLGLQRLSQVKDLCARADQYVQKEQFEDAIPVLEQANSLAPENVWARKLLVDSLYGLAARRLDGNDLSAATELLDRLLSIDRNHERARALHEVVQERKRNEFVGQTIARAEELRLQGQLPAALTLLKDGLKTYRSEPRLSGRLDEFQKLSRDQARQQAIDRLRTEVETLRKTRSFVQAQERIREVMAEHGDGPQLQELLATVRKEVADQRKQESIAALLDEIQRLEEEKTLPALRKALMLVTESPYLDATASSLLECRERLEKKIEEASASFAQHEARINECFEQQDLEGALDFVRQALQIDPEDQRLHALEKRVARKVKLQRWLKPLKQVSLPAVPKRVYKAAGIAALVVVALALGYGGYWLLKIRTTGTARLVIDSVPTGARVFIANQEKGITPYRESIPLPSAAQQISIKFVLSGYIDSEQVLTLEPGKTEYNLSGIVLTKVPPSPGEEAVQRAQLSYDRLSQMLPESADFLPEIDQFVGAINQVLGTSTDQSEPRGQATNLKGQLKANLMEKLSGLQTGTSKEQLLLEAINRVDPDDAEIRDKQTKPLDNLKAQIGAAKQKKLFLSSEAGGALTPLKRLIDSFPAEQNYYQAQVKDIASKVISLLQEKCQGLTPDCQRYGEIARIDFPNDPRIPNIVKNAPPVTTRPTTTNPAGPGPTPPPPPPPTRPPVELTITQNAQRMEAAFAQKRYVLPLEDSSSQLASTIVQLSGTSPSELSRDANLLVVRARDLRTVSLQLATQEAGRLTQSSRLVQALTSRKAATDVRADLDLSQKMIEAVATFGSNPELTALSGKIKTWLPGLQRLLDSRQYPVSHSHSFGSCNGILTIDGFGIEYASSERPADNFQIPYDLAGTSGDAGNVQQFDARRDGDSLAVKRLNPGPAGKVSNWKLKYRQSDASATTKATEMQQAIEEFRKVRAGIMQAGQR